MSPNSLIYACFVVVLRLLRIFNELPKIVRLLEVNSVIMSCFFEFKIIKDDGYLSMKVFSHWFDDR